jgi:hypothetical protein
MRSAPVPPESTSNSTPPAELGAPNVVTIMSSMARASRGARSNEDCAADAGQFARKHR